MRDLGPRPYAEFEIVVAVFGGLLVLELVAIEELALSMGQGASLHRLFQSVDVSGLQLRLAAIEIGGGSQVDLNVAN